MIIIRPHNLKWLLAALSAHAIDRWSANLHFLPSPYLIFDRLMKVLENDQINILQKEKSTEKVELPILVYIDRIVYR